MRWVLITPLTLALLPALASAQSAESPRPAQAGFPWVLAPRAQPATTQMPGADLLSIWRNDTAREERKEHAHWAVDSMVTPAAASQPGSMRSTEAYFFFLLLAVFLVPAFALLLLSLALLQIRHGHRLQSAIFGLAGCAILAVVVGAGQELRGSSPVLASAESARLRAQCQAEAMRITGFVYDVTAEGVIVTDFSEAQADEHGWIVVVSDKRSARSGEKWQLVVFHVGSLAAPNAIVLPSTASFPARVSIAIHLAIKV